MPDATYDSLMGTTWHNNTPAFDESGWISGLLGVGYDTGSTYDSDIGLDVELDMKSINGSLYIRIPFAPVASPGDVIELTLRMKYDDGFAAFLNGTPVAAANAPATPLWNSFATTGHSDDAAQIFVDYDITAFRASLSTSTNILSIHGLNASLTSSDLLLLPQLTMRSTTNAATTIGFLETPTPGTANASTSFDGVVEDTSFVVGRGIFTNAFTETFTCTEPGATLIHTLDGSMPTLSNGILTLPPDPATAPTGTISITSTTTLRVRAVKTDFLPTNIDTQTYIYPNDVIHQTGAGYPLPSNKSLSDWDYVMDPEIINDPRFPDVAGDLLTLPSMSVVMDREILWGPDGVYANPLSYGMDYEGACSVEYIQPDGSPGFQEDGGIRIQGSGSRRRPWSKKSLRVVFRAMYGAGKLDFPLFGEQGAQKLDNIILRGDYFDSWTVHVEGSAEGIARKNAMVLRDEYGRQTHRDMGAKTVIHGGWVHLYLNGMYWGVYNTHERPDQNFAEDRFGGDKDEYDVIKHGMEIVSGDRVAWDQLISTINGNITDPSVYASVREQLDVDEFADYLLMNFYGGNNDWPHNNWYVMRHRPSNAPFTFVAWDV
ncbi:MAG: CotH kinase family protein, partial [Verrucomicrobia bacterium]|nr:CotH kinase family protein [Verrucomicrobiota bacterium]